MLIETAVILGAKYVFTHAAAHYALVHGVAGAAAHGTGTAAASSATAHGTGVTAAVGLGGHGLASNWTAASQHPLEWALHQGAQHGIHRASRLMMDPSVPLITKVALADVAYAQASAALAASGTAVTATAPLTWHTAAKWGEHTAASLAKQWFRETETYETAKTGLSEFLSEVKSVKDLTELKGLLEDRGLPLLHGLPAEEESSANPPTAEDAITYGGTMAFPRPELKLGSVPAKSVSRSRPMGIFGRNLSDFGVPVVSDASAAARYQLEPLDPFATYQR
jgi:hypothetical protein